MAKLAPGFHLFSKNKVFVRSLIIYQCIYKMGLDENDTKLVSIERTYKELNDGYRQEAANLDYAIFPRGGTFHLHDLFLTDSFGITVRFLNGKAQIETMDSKSNVQAHPLVFLSLQTEEELQLLSYVEANPVV